MESIKNDNLLMWSHYAAGLRGFCIEFDGDLLLSKCADTAKIYDVLYSDIPSRIDTAVMAVLNDQVDFHYCAIGEAETQIKHLGKDLKSEIQMYEDWLKIVFKKNDEIYQKMLAAKPREWSYEEEVRVIAQAMNEGKAGEFLRYPRESIKSVNVGERMPDRQKRTIKKLLGQHSHTIDLKTAARAHGEFRVELSDGI